MLWSAAFVFLLAGMLLPPEPGDDVSRMGLAVGGVATVAHIRIYFVRHEANMKNAFELGRDAAMADIVRIPTPR